MVKTRSSESKTAKSPRPPVVTLLGHVDHGKTSILDAIRETNVTAKEIGSMTQHIGAYQIEHKGKKITFIDTPGHEAFTQMRARGGQVCDIVILVVAANDGVKSQTRESIAHAKTAKVPIIVAINKIDLSSADPDKVKEQLVEEGVVVEDFGGDAVCVEISATKKKGLDTLLEMILLVAEMQELKSKPTAPLKGVVIESSLDAKKGPLATILVKEGTLKTGQEIVAGIVGGKVKLMTNDRGKKVAAAGPGMPVEVLGFKDILRVGDEVADKSAQKEKQKGEEEEKVVKLSEFYQKSEDSKVRVLNLVLKSDTQGTLEAIQNSLLKLETEEFQIRIIHAATGDITESDILLASVAKGIIIGFNIGISRDTEYLALCSKVEVRCYNLIFELIEDVAKALKGLLEEKEETCKGRAEVLKLFPLPSGDIVLGAAVTGGKLKVGCRVEILRESEPARSAESTASAGGEQPVYKGAIKNLKHGKDVINEAKCDTECGILLKPQFKDAKIGDIVNVL